MLLAHHILVDTLAPSEIAPGARVVCRDPDNRDLCILVAAALTWAAHSSVAATCVAADIFATQPKYASMPPIRTGTNRPAFASIGFGSGRFPPQNAACGGLA
jgi:hypothetical protein